MLEVTGARHWQGLGSSPGGLTASDGLAGGDGMRADLGEAVCLWKVTDQFKSFLTYQQCGLGTSASL